MPRLTGHEASTLAYLAEFPNASDAEEKIFNLGIDAREVALAIIGKNPNPSQKVLAAAQAIKSWAKNKEELCGLYEVRSCPDCNHSHLCQNKV